MEDNFESTFSYHFDAKQTFSTLRIYMYVCVRARACMHVCLHVCMYATLKKQDYYTRSLR